MQKLAENLQVGDVVAVPTDVGKEWVTVKSIEQGKNTFTLHYDCSQKLLARMPDYARRYREQNGCIYITRRGERYQVR